MNVNQYFEQAQLALAAYALQLTSDATNGQFINALKTGGMTENQAQRFADRYEIISSQSTPSSGFAATLFRERVTPETVAAGTAG